jgi:hypothetical protein
MNHKDKSRDRKALVNLGQEQSYLTSEAINDFLPRDVHPSGDLGAALETFEGRDIKLLDEVPGGSTGADQASPRRSPRKRASMSSANPSTRSASI